MRNNGNFHLSTNNNTFLNFSYKKGILYFSENGAKFSCDSSEAHNFILTNKKLLNHLFDENNIELLISEINEYNLFKGNNFIRNVVSGNDIYNFILKNNNLHNIKMVVLDNEPDEVPYPVKRNIDNENVPSVTLDMTHTFEKCDLGDIPVPEDFFTSSLYGTPFMVYVINSCDITSVIPTVLSSVYDSYRYDMNTLKENIRFYFHFEDGNIDFYFYIFNPEYINHITQVENEEKSYRHDCSKWNYHNTIRNLTISKNNNIVLNFKNTHPILWENVRLYLEYNSNVERPSENTLSSLFSGI